ncbi:MAG: CRISPR-associated helicase Cas3' [Thermofilaceae archaeon]
MARRLIERALEIVEKDLSDGVIPRIILEAPTGYGKSVAAPLFASTLIKHGLSYSLIHSLPLRAIVRDLYLCLLVNSLTRNANLREDCKKSEEVLREVAEALKSVNIGVDQVAYQMGELISSEIEAVRKEPLFNARYIVTTLDSLAYNMFRIPVTEIFNPKKHYATPRLRIYLSTLYLDEAHTIYEEEEDLERSATVFREILKISVAGNIPLIIASATLSNCIEEEIAKELKEVRIVKLGENDKVEGKRVYVRDEDFEDFIKSITWKTDFIEEQELINKVRELVESDLKVFVARDTVCSAIKTYRDLKEALGLRGNEITLLHGLMTKQDREEALKKLYSGKVKVLIATSVVEAGVDISFDVLITDCGRPASIVQRIGRVCRTPSTCKHAEVAIYLVKNQYLSEEVKEFVDNVKQSGREVSWRLPYDTGDLTSYMKLLNSVEKRVKMDIELAKRLRALTNPLFVSSKTIENILKTSMSIALIRTYLTEVLTKRAETLQRDQGDLDTNIMTTSIDKLALLAKRGCIEGLYVVFGDGVRKIENLSWLENEVLGVREKKLQELLIKRHLNALGKLMRDPAQRYRVLRLAYLLKENCYVEGEGVKYGVLCLQRNGL